ncbi:SOS response-associated peptidase [Psychroflexus aestuariivivens]|uniref:SOS response-associated peptidase n=1 Tax=Psychroflexus aestuariivivens TaxID=1795040 RepID=UPI000FDA82E6|nr:SOS response-associated peptidase [Psychroflexus aestuariivivens]
MCFHTSQTKSVVQLEQRYDVRLAEEAFRTSFDQPQYHLNGFAHPELLVIPQEEPSVIAPGLWGIVPDNKSASGIQDYYKQAVKYGGGLNARSEKLFDHFIYKRSALSRRCIIPVTGFFEPHEHQGKKYPFHFKHEQDEVLSLAGLYTFIDGVMTFTILTKSASPLFAKIHNKKNRQPVLLSPDHEQDWLSDGLSATDVQDLIDLPFDDGLLNTYPVSRDLFSPKVDSNVDWILEEVDYSFRQ